jgi:hypothetical protein
MWIVKWKSKHTEAKGESVPMTYALALAWKRRMNQECGDDVNHWLEEKKK